MPAAAVGSGIPPRPLSEIEYLSLGQKFKGQQMVDRMEDSGHNNERNNWEVWVTIEATDLEKGILCGTMEALDVPKASTPVVTFFTGEIVDNVNYRFRTRKWNAKEMTDTAHWHKFECFHQFEDRVRDNGGDDIDLSDFRYVFMRWKEIHFVNVNDDCGLTIAGFYYMCLDRKTGEVTGYYYDPGTVPFQKLMLKPYSGLSGGRTSATYSFV